MNFKEKINKFGARLFDSRLFKDESGQSMTEYILILSVVVMLVIKFKKNFSKQMDSAVEELGSNLTSALKDGQ